MPDDPSGSTTAVRKPQRGVKVVLRTPAGVPAGLRLVGPGPDRSVSKPAAGSRLVHRFPARPGRYRVVVSDTWSAGRTYRASRPVTTVRVGAKGTAVVRLRMLRVRGASDMQVTDVTATSAALAWRGPKGTYVLRRAVGATAPRTRTSGSPVRFRAGAARVEDTGLAPGTQYSYGLFTRTAAGWSDPVAITVATPSARTDVSYAAKPGAVVLEPGDRVVASVSDGTVSLQLPRGTSLPAVGAGIVVPAQEQVGGLELGMVGVVTGVGADGRSVTIVNGTLPDVFDSFDGQTSLATFRPGQARRAVQARLRSSATYRAALADCVGVGREVTMSDLRFDTVLDGSYSARVTTSWHVPTGVSMDMRVSPRITVSSDLATSLNGSCTIPIPRVTWSGAIGPVPVGLALTPEIGFEGSISAQLDDLTYAVTTGVEAHAAFGLTGLKEKSGGLLFEDQAISVASASVAGKLETTVGFSLEAGIGSAAGEAGVLVGLKGDVDLIDASVTGYAGTDGLCASFDGRSTAGLSLSAHAWAGPLDEERALEIPGLSGEIPWTALLPADLPAGCTPNVGGTPPTPTPTTTPTPTPTPDPAAPCSPSDPTSFSTYTGTSVSTECIAGVEVSTRAELDDGVPGSPCLLGIAKPHDSYSSRKACGKGPEAIGQARMISRINTDPAVRSALGLSSPGGDSRGRHVARGLQWETTMRFDPDVDDPTVWPATDEGEPQGAIRPDLIAYDPTSASGRMKVAEVKVYGNSTLKTAYRDQVRPAVKWWQTRLGADRVEGLDVTGYHDEFTMCGTKMVAEAEDLAGPQPTKSDKRADEPNSLVVVTPVGKGQLKLDQQHLRAGEQPAACPELVPHDPNGDPTPPPPDACMAATGGDDGGHDTIGDAIDRAVASGRTEGVLDGFLRDLGDELGGGESSGNGTPGGGGCPGGGGWGDPHLTTLDGMAYDLQSAGEFRLLEAPAVGLRVQARLEPWLGRQVSVMTRFAMEVNGFAVEIDKDNHLWINGQRTDLADGEMAYLNGGALVVRLGGEHVVLSPRVDHQAVALLVGPYTVAVAATPGLATSGLLGDHDGDPLDDLVTADGNGAEPGAEGTFLHGPFADSWRITQAESLFTYAEGESTASYDDRDFPREIPSFSDYPVDEVADARAACAGVQVGSARDACVLDVLVTGSTQWVDQAERISSSDWTAVPLELDATGPAVVDFGSTVPLNFVGERSRVTGVGGVAGPYTSSGHYEFELPVNANHAGISATTDFVVMGAMAQSRTRSISVRLGDTTAVVKVSSSGATTDHGTLTRTAEGSLADGSPWVRYQLALALPPADAVVRGTYDVAGFSRVQGDRVGIARIEVALVDATEAPVRTIAVGDTVWPDATLVGSNGVLDAVGQRERWRFTITADTPAVGLYPISGRGLSYFCSSATLVRVEDHERLEPCFEPTALEPGEYELRVATPRDTWNLPFRYGIHLWTPSPEDPAFEATVGTDPVVFGPEDGTGAGVLPDRNSFDTYDLHVVEEGNLVVEVSCIQPSAGCVELRSLFPDLDQNGYDTSYRVTPGDYTLRLYGDTGRRTYRLTLRVEPYVVHDLALGQVVRPGQGDGLGTLTEAHPVDRFRFTVAEDGQVYLDMLPGLLLNEPTQQLVCRYWKLRDSNGQTFDACFGWVYGTRLPAGTYTLAVKLPRWADVPHHYGFEVYTDAQATHQQFAGGGRGRTVLSASSPLTIEPDRSTGVGFVDNRQSDDTYTFTTSEPGLVHVEVDCTPEDPYEPGDDCAYDAIVRDDQQSRDLATSGSAWTLTVRNGDFGPHDYSVRVSLEPVIAYAVGDTVADGSHGADAGTFTGEKDDDLYAFSVSTAGRYVLGLVTGVASSRVDGTLYRSDTGEVVGRSGPGSPVDLEPGTYLLRVSASRGDADLPPAPYRMRYYPVPAPVSTVLAPDAGGTYAAAGSLGPGTAERHYVLHLAADTEFRRTTSGPVDVFLSSDTASVEELGTHRIRLAAGDWTVVVSPTGRADLDPVDFTFALAPRPAAPPFDLTIGRRVTPDPSTGAGILTDSADVDRYRFTVPEDAPDLAIVTTGPVTACDTALVRDGQPTDVGCGDPFGQYLEPGTYVLTVSRASDDGSDDPVEYTLSVVAPQVRFETARIEARPDEFVSPAQLAVGIAADGGVRDYVVTVDPDDAELAQWLVVESTDPDACPTVQLLRPDGDVARGGCRAALDFAVPGEYHLRVTGPGGSGYGFLVYLTNEVDPSLVEDQGGNT